MSTDSDVEEDNDSDKESENPENNDHVTKKSWTINLVWHTSERLILELLHLKLSLYNAKNFPTSQFMQLVNNLCKWYHPHIAEQICDYSILEKIQKCLGQDDKNLDWLNELVRDSIQGNTQFFDKEKFQKNCIEILVRTDSDRNFEEMYMIIDNTYKKCSKEYLDDGINKYYQWDLYSLSDLSTFPITFYDMDDFNNSIDVLKELQQIFTSTPVTSQKFLRFYGEFMINLEKYTDSIIFVQKQFIGLNTMEKMEIAEPSEDPKEDHKFFHKRSLIGEDCTTKGCTNNNTIESV